ncbi:MAG TPA: ABC transporter permease [Planctomycetota bacterium]
MAESRLDPGPAADAWSRARASLARSRAFRVARLGLVLVSGLAVLAPFLASDRPLYLVAAHPGEFERARGELVPLTVACAAQLGPAGEPTARVREAAAVALRLARLAEALGDEAPGSIAGFEATLARALALAEAGAVPPGTDAELVQRARALASELAPLQSSLPARRSSPLAAGLTPLEVGLVLAWGLALLAPLRRRLGLPRALGLAGLAGLAAGVLWSAAVGAGRSFPTGHFKEALTEGEIVATRAWFAPVPYGFAEQHPEEALRPPTWLAAAELDPTGAYLRGPRVPRPDPVTGFVPRTRPVEVRAGEPALNAAARHWLGTDATGRDVLARVIHGARASLAVGALATALLMLLGIAVGGLAGSLGGRVDVFVSRAIEVVSSFPLLFLVLVAVAFVGPSLGTVCLVLGGVGWTGVARLTRAEFLRQRELDYVAAARALGFSRLRIALVHVLPNALAPLLVAATFTVAGVILVEAALSFLGYGVRVPVPSWGALSSETRELANWWLLVFPGAFLFATVLCLQLAGDALRTALDPRTAVERLS